MAGILLPDGVVQLGSVHTLFPGGVVQVTAGAVNVDVPAATLTLTGYAPTVSIATVAVATPTSVGLSGKSTRSTKRGRKGEKLVIIEEVDDLIDEVEEILEEVEQVVRKEPKKKADIPAKKPQQEVSTETVFDWLAYYGAMLYRLRDQQRAQALQNRLNMAITIAVQAYQKAEAERLAYEAFLLDEEEVAILLAA